MNQRHPVQSPKPGFAILLAITLLFCLIVAEVLDLAAGADNPTLLWTSVALLLVMLFLLTWLLWRMRRSRITFSLAQPSPLISSKVTRLILLILCLLAAGLRFYQLGAEGFWYDEVWTASWADQALSDVVKVVNPWAYTLAHYSLQLGRSDFVLRFAPAVAGVLAVPVVYHLGRVLYRRREGLVAAFLFSTSLYAIYHNQDLRFYAWQMLFSTLSLYFLLRGLDQNRIRYWAGFALSTALNLYNHPFALLVLASEGLYVAFALTQDVLFTKNMRPSPWLTKLQAWIRRAAWPAAAVAGALAIYLPQLSQLLRFINPKWSFGLQSTQLQPLVGWRAIQCSSTLWAFTRNKRLPRSSDWPDLRSTLSGIK